MEKKTKKQAEMKTMGAVHRRSQDTTAQALLRRRGMRHALSALDNGRSALKTSVFGDDVVWDTSYRLRQSALILLYFYP